MRYLGNKESILDEIRSLLETKDLIKSEYSFFDAFCGSGSVADYFKQFYNKIIINDSITTTHPLIAKECILQQKTLRESIIFECK